MQYFMCKSCINILQSIVKNIGNFLSQLFPQLRFTGALPIKSFFQLLEVSASSKAYYFPYAQSHFFLTPLLNMIFCGMSNIILFLTLKIVIYFYFS